jgi:hypothetical protein
MTVAASVAALATRLATEFNSVRTALAAKADDAAVVHDTGTETIDGAKTFSTAPVIPVGTLTTHPVRRDDDRLTDARTPTAHVHSGADVTTGTVAYARLPVGTAASTVAAGDDSRITGATPSTRSVIAGTGLTGGGTLAADRTLTVSYGTTAGTAAQGNDTRITSATPTSRAITAGTGLTGGGDLSANRTLAVAYGSAASTAVQGNDTRVTADQAVATASIRTIGTGALQAAAGTAPAAAVAAHEAAGDPHPQYLTVAEADALYRALNPAPRTAPITGNVNVDVGSPGDVQLTLNTATAFTLTPTLGVNGRTCVVEVFASVGATRTATWASTVKLTDGVTALGLAIPASRVGVFLIRYSTLGGLNQYELASAYLRAA